jgi:CheY-like chemotaxis protein
MAAGFDAFLSKPIDFEAFLQAVADGLKRRGSGGAP